MNSRLLHCFVIVAVFAASAGCAGMQRQDPLQVTVAGIESLPGEGMELRMLVKLRVQNPNDAPLDYDGVYVKLDVLEQASTTQRVKDVIGHAVASTVGRLRPARRDA